MASKAQQTITVKFIPDGQQGLINAIKSLDRASKNLTGTQNSLNESIKRTRKPTRILGGTFATIRSKMLLFNFAMALGVRQLGRFAVQASKVESMGRAFNTLIGSTEGSRASLEKLKNATNDTMSEFDLFQQANNAMVLGVSKNSDEMAEMFDIAQRLGRALGRDTASSVESLVTGIGRQSRLMLDNIGIIVKADEAYESYAKQLGINVEQLTDAEKKQAFLQATMESARAKVKTLGAETLTTQDVYDKLSSASSDLASATGNVLAPLMTTMASVFTSLAKSATSYFNSITIARKPINEFTSNEEAMVILLARRAKAQKAVDDFERRSSKEKMDALHIQKINKEKLAEIDKKLLELNLGNMKAIVDSTKIQEDKNGVDGEAITKGLYRKEIAQQELDILRNKNEALLGGMSIQEELSLIEDQRILNQLKKNDGSITEQEFRKKNLELIGQEITLEHRLSQAKIKTVSDTLGALSQLAQSNKKTFELGKNLALAQAIIDAYGAGNKVLNSKLPFPTNVIAMAGVIATGLSNVNKINAQKFETGGLVGGNRHSQGGTIIEAEQGEFVMSRNAVESIGLENLAEMNQGGGTGVTINIQGNMIGNQEFVRDTLIPEIDKTINGGFA
jgi:hypothetical protein|tara:strand:+ start:350 stop:2215 length:1866 start_codon:yes stop_codon:yes gene_type:complete